MISVHSGIVAEKPSSELFTLDPTGDQRIQRAYNKIHKPLKADEILAQRSAVPPIDSRKRPTSRTTDGVLESSNKRRRSGVVSHKELERLKKLAYGGEHVYKDVVAYTDAPEYDPWAENQNPLMGEMESRFSFLEAKKPVREPKTLKRAPVSLAADGKAIPAVQKPKPEASYNPQSTDYFEAYIREGEKAVEEEKKRLRAAEEERERLERAAKSGAEVEVKEKELSDENENEASEWEGIQSEVESSAGSHKRPERKTRAQRNKIARRKEAERKAAWEAAMKKRAQQAAQIKTIARSIEEKERVKSTIAIIASTTAAEEEDQEGETAVQLRKRRFGKAPYVFFPLTITYEYTTNISPTESPRKH